MGKFDFKKKESVMAKRLMVVPKFPKREVKYLAMTRTLSKMDASKSLLSRSRNNCGSSLEKMPKVCVFSFIGFPWLRDAVFLILFPDHMKPKNMNLGDFFGQ